MSIEAILEELTAPATPIAASKLVKLSGLTAGDVDRFAGAWLVLDARRREHLIEELVDLAEDNVELDFDAVFLVALGDDDPKLRRAAIQGLWDHEGRDLIDPLLHLLERDPDAGVRAEAALALGRFVLQSEFDRLRTSDAERIDAALRRTIGNEQEVTEVRARALEAAGARSEEWARELIRNAYDEPERRMRISAVHAMGRSCDPEWLPSLITELSSDDAEMRFEAAGALGSLGDPEAAEHLLPLLADDDTEVQEAAIAALGEIGGADAKDALQELAAGDDERVRDAALAALDVARFNEDPLGVSLEKE